MPFIAPIVEAVVAVAASVGSFVAGLGVIGQGIILAGVGVAATYLISALTPKPQTDNSSGNSPSGVNFQRQYGADVSRQVLCGVAGLAGHDVYVNTYGPSNVTLQQIYVLSDFPCTALSRVAMNGAYVTLGPDEVAGSDPGDNLGFPVLDGDFFGFVWIKFYDGTQTAADSALVTHANPAGRWPATNVGTGVSYVKVTMNYDQNRNNSFPDFFFEVKGAPLYDFRLDDTAGGSGPQRWGDISTYAFSENPVIIEYNYRRGFTINGDFFCGMDMPATDLPLDKWITAANICDEEAADGLARYRCSIMLDCMTTHSDNLQAISLSCGSMQIDAVDGSWPLVGSDQSAVATFTDQDIISLADFKYTAKQSMSSLVNSVSGNFPDPEQLWSMVGYEPQIAADFVVIDRRTRDISMDFPQVRWARQAAQLAWIYLFENRFEITATTTLRPRYQVFEAGDWVNWNSKRYGLNTFIVTGTQLLSLDNTDNGPRSITVSLQQRDGSIYNGVTPPPIVIPPPNGQPVYSSEVENFALIAVSVVGASGVAQPAIRVSWDAITDVTVVQVEVIYFPTAQPSSVITQTVSATMSVVNLTSGIVGNTDYTVQARIITDPMRTTVFNAGAHVQTLNILVGMIDIDAAVTYNITTLQDQLADSLAQVTNLISSLSSNTASRTWLDKKSLKSDLHAVAGNASADIATLQQVVVDNQTAFAQFEATVTATFGPSFSSVDTVSSAVAQLDGYAAASWSVTLSVDGFISGIQLINGGSGTSAAIFLVDSFQIAAPSGTTGGAPIDVFTLGRVSGVEKIGIKADMFIDGTITATMMQVTTLSAISANIGTVTAGELRSASGNMVIDLDNNRITISS